MTFSKLSFIAAICLGISGLVSCSGIESKPAESIANLPYTSTPGTCCISDGSDCTEPQESAPVQESRKRSDDEAPQDDVGCIMPSVVE